MGSWEPMTGAPLVDGKTVFGQYQLVEELGAGGMGTVHRALALGPEGFARQVVVKRVRAELAGEPRLVQLFLTEARLSALLHHPYIVQVHALGEVAGEYFLAMELVDGVDLVALRNRARQRGEPMPVGVALHLALQL